MEQLDSTRLDRPVKKTRASPDIIIDRIRLRDGRVYSVPELLKKVQKPEQYNLRVSNPRQPMIKKPVNKYSVDEKLWMTTATIKQVMERHKLSENYARVLISMSRKFAKDHGLG